MRGREKEREGGGGEREEQEDGTRRIEGNSRKYMTGEIVKEKERSKESRSSEVEPFSGLVACLQNLSGMASGGFYSRFSCLILP